jgi:ferrous iron transport protein B
MTSLAKEPAGLGGPTRPEVESPSSARLALLGNPNTGKTTLFNRLCGVRARTANFPGSTAEARLGDCRLADHRTIQIIDLPGVYGLHLGLPESQLCRDCLEGRIAAQPRPDALIVVADATNLPRNLLFVAQVLRLGIPSVVALNMIDLAQRRGLSIDAEKLSARLGCPVVAICARSGEGIDSLKQAMIQASRAAPGLPDADGAAAREWADELIESAVGGARAVGSSRDTLTDRADLAFTHPVAGLVIFAAVMTGLFATIFWLASYPMEWIDAIFTHLGQGVRAALPEGAIRDLLADGIVAGVAGTVVFLPQICLLFFLITLLEDTGYLARAAFVMDRLLRRFGLPGQAFVPLLSAHACAIPAIMSTRLIPDHRDRLATILVAPFMSCSARLPVYVLLISVLFPQRPIAAALAFLGCYALGAAAALLTALLFRRTILRGQARPMMLELPSYKRPSLRTAALATFDRAVTFLRKAGTIIMAICIVLWWLGAYPQSDPSAESQALREQAAAVAVLEPETAAELEDRAARIEAAHALDRSFIGRVGRAAEPVFRPIGADWQLTIGILSSFAAREVFVSTMTVVLSAGRGDEDEADPSVLARLSGAARDDGSPVFSTASSASLLIFYVLAMQCLPTLAVTARETGRWRWAVVQLAYMSALAYAAAFITHSILTATGVN